MTPSKHISLLLIVIFITVLLAACGVVVPAPTSSPSSTFTPAIPTASVPVSSAPDGLRMAYIVDGNLYFQDGSNPPVQLTGSREDWRPLSFSEDGEEIFFFRGEIPFDLFSISVDGSQEQALVTNDQLTTIGIEYDVASTVCNPTIIPGTRLILFNTCVYPEPNNPYIVSGNRDLLTVDTDTGEIKRLLSPGKAGYFYDVSPDGKQIAMDREGQIDIIDVNGETLQDNLLTYTPSEPIPLAPHIYWTEDSTTLTILLPAQTFYDTSGGAPTYTIWRHSLHNNITTQVHLDPLPKSHNIAQVSPNGNWVLYENDEQFSFYLGDLIKGNAQLYEPQPPIYRYEWSRDNGHFIYEVAGDALYLGAVTAPPTLIGKADFIGWADADHYIYYDYASRSILMGGIEREASLIFPSVPKALFPSNPDRFIFTWTTEYTK